LRIVIPGSGGDEKGWIGGDAGVGRLAQFEERGEGAAEFAVIGGFETKLEGEDSGVVSEVTKGDGGEDGSRGEGRVRLGGARHFEFEAGGLHAPEAEQAPAGHDHGLDQEGFGGVAGVELEGESGGEFVEAPDGFAVQDHGAGHGVVASGAL